MFNLDTHARPGRSPKASACTPPGEARCCPAPILLGGHAPSASSGGEVTSILCSDPPPDRGLLQCGAPPSPIDKKTVSHGFRVPWATTPGEKVMRCSPHDSPPRPSNSTSRRHHAECRTR